MANWTDRQMDVIRARNCDLLVSAAAGAGKTAVLVERILRRILDPEDPVDIDRLLVVTFTRAAAGEMKERIRGALEKALRADPHNSRLQRQAALVSHARITTIDSFCMDVVRSHFHEIDLDPGFRVADEGELKLIRQDVLAEVMEQAYLEADPQVIRFTQVFAHGKSDAPIEELIERFYHFSQAHPYPASWRQSSLKAAVFADLEEMEQCEWMQQMLGNAHRIVEDMRARSGTALRIAAEEDGPGSYLPCLQEDASLLDELAACRTYRDYRAVLGDKINWKRAPGGKKKENVSAGKLARVKTIREQVKKNINSLREKYFAWEPETALEVCRLSVDMIRALTKLTDRFEEAFTAEKSARGVVDFSDVEHFALKILVKSEEDPVPTATALEYRDYFREVMTDEYQDSNLVQELILKAVSKEEEGSRNRFMVGDVKQSIYRFRQARPQLFIEKYETYSNGEDASERRIDLLSNFRSRPQVIGLVNKIFEKIMTAGVGGIDYDENAALKSGADFPEGPDEKLYIPELLLVQEPGGDGEDDGEELPGAVEQEADVIASKIEETVGNLPVWDKEKGEYRPAAYGDIVILMRSLSSRADTFVKVLSDRGIPARAEKGSGYFAAAEVQTLMAMLTILDNPHQDHPLYCVLHSPMGGFTDEELARIRVRFPDDDLYRAICLAAEEEPEASGGKMRNFLALFKRLRRMVPFTPIHELIWKILDETGYMDIAGAMSAGPSRRANLEMLSAQAQIFEQGSYRGLFNFVRYIEKLQKYEVDYAEASSPGEEDQTVRIMSIHKSKGLEFPVVIVAGLGTRFNRSDSTSRLVLHPDLGAACDLVDPEKRTRTNSLMRSCISSRISEEDMGEELRILYVAMTRAREKLILCGRISSVEDAYERFADTLTDKESPLSVTDIMRAGSFLDLILPVALSGEGILSENDLAIVQCFAHGAAGEAKEEGPGRDFYETDKDIVYHEALRESLGRALAPRTESSPLTIPLKVSVSEVKHAYMDEQLEDESFKKIVPGADSDPRLFVSVPHGQGMLAGADLGTLYHRFMEHIDFTDDAGAERQLESMVNCGKIHEDEKRNIRPEVIDLFLESDLARRMRRAAEAGKLRRETPFVIAVPACEVDSSWPEDQFVLVQGIIDAWFEEDDSIILVDYKTDRVPVDEPGYLARLYHAQMDLYRRALEQLTEKRTAESWLYSFALERAVRADDIPVRDISN